MKRAVMLVAILSLLALGTAEASMTQFIAYTEKGAGLSIDAIGLNDNTLGSISAQIPSGSSVYKAFLYSADVWGSGLSNVEFGGSTLISNGLSRLDVGLKDANPASENRWDVTSVVQSKVGGGSGLFNFNLKELGYLDGEILAVLYDNPAKPLNTAFIFDGELATTGDSFTIGLSTPVNKSDPDFQAIMSLGISYGYQPADQYSQVDVNGQRLSTSAGGYDDGFGANGGLITAGGLGDSILNPADPFATDGGGPLYDDELYSLNDFLNNGDTSITINTINPSNDDNIFFMGFTTLGKAQVGPPPPPSEIPEPASLLLLGSGLLGLGGMGRFRKKRKR